MAESKLTISFSAKSWPVTSAVASGDQDEMYAASVDALEWDARYSAIDSLWSEEPNVFLVAKAEGLTPGRALDLGCGEGRNALWLAERGWEVTAVDFSQVAIDRGRGRAERRGISVDFQVTDVIDYRPEPAAFDLVIVFYLQLPHEEVREVLEHAVDAVAPGGALLVVAHDLDNLAHGYGGPPSADVLYTVELVTDSLEDLEIVEAGQVKRPVSTPAGDRVAIDTLVLAQRT